MSSPLLIAAAAIAVLVAAGHSYLGERYILMRLFRRDLPKLFGSDDFTKRTLRLAWHITSVLALGLAVLLVSDIEKAKVIAVTFALSGLVSLLVSRGKHLSWVAFFAAAALAWFG